MCVCVCAGGSSGDTCVSGSALLGLSVFITDAAAGKTHGGLFFFPNNKPFSGRMFSECGWWEDVSISTETVWEQRVLARWVLEHFSGESNVSQTSKSSVEASFKWVHQRVHPTIKMIMLVERRRRTTGKGRGTGRFEGRNQTPGFTFPTCRLAASLWRCL